MNEKQQAALKLYLESATLFNDYTPDSDAVIALFEEPQWGLKLFLQRRRKQNG